jgi:hypothetical protein
LFNAYVLRPFAVADPGALYEVHWLGKDRSVRMHPWRDYQEIRARRDVFADALASRGVCQGVRENLFDILARFAYASL